MKKWVRSLLTIAVIGVFAGALSVSQASGQSPIREILNRMDAHNKSLTTLRAKVTMVKTNAQLGESDTQTGTAIYARGKGREPLVRIDWAKPEESLAVKNGQYVMFVPRQGIAYTGLTKNAGKQGKSSSALAFMNMSKAELQANYDVVLLSDKATLSSGVRTWHLQLTPKSKTTYKTAEVWVDPDGMPHQTRIVEQNNDTTTVLLTGLEKNINLKTSNFEISLPKGTKVQKT
jgi:outer membrane lipoprotein-sorting protein